MRSVVRRRRRRADRARRDRAGRSTATTSMRCWRASRSSCATTPSRTTSTTSARPAGCWREIEAGERGTGGDVLAARARGLSVPGDDDRVHERRARAGARPRRAPRPRRAADRRHRAWRRARRRARRLRPVRRRLHRRARPPSPVAERRLLGRPRAGAERRWRESSVRRAPIAGCGMRCGTRPTHWRCCRPRTARSRRCRREAAARGT